MKKDGSILACFGLIVFATIGVVIGAIMDGWALSVLWTWFISPLFGLPALSIPYAIGLGLVVSMLVNVPAPQTKTNDWSDALAAVLTRIVFTPLITVFMGWIVYSFVH